MNPYYAAAGSLAFVIGLVHSVLGERLIFQRMRRDGLVPTEGGGLLRERHVRILWASWHAVSVLGWGFAAVLIWLSMPSSDGVPHVFLGHVIAAAMLVASLLVAIGTRLRHPGWAGLLGVAILVWLA